MSLGRRRKMFRIALCSASALASLSAVPALAQEQSASSRGLVEITRSVGVGIVFDVLTEAISGVFLEGQPGDSVSLLLPPRPALAGGNRHIPGEVVALSTASYKFDISGKLPPANPPARRENGGARLQLAGYGAAPGNLLFLAQFN